MVGSKINTNIKLSIIMHDLYYKDTITIWFIYLESAWMSKSVLKSFYDFRNRIDDLVFTRKSFIHLFS